MSIVFFLVEGPFDFHSGQVEFLQRFGGRIVRISGLARLTEREAKKYQADARHLDGEGVGGNYFGFLLLKQNSGPGGAAGG